LRFLTAFVFHNWR